MADLRNHSLDGSNEKAVERLRLFIQDSKLEEEWDEETQKDWNEKMADIGKWQKITEDELRQLRKEGKIN